MVFAMSGESASSNVLPGAWVETLSKSVLDYVVVGWQPTVAVPESGHITADWPLAKLEVALAICISYLAFVALGMLFMPLVPAVPDKFVYPFKFVYNLMQVSLCAYMAIEALILASRNNYSTWSFEKSNPFDAANPQVAKLLWLFYLTKGLDFFDTITIVLQKRWSQLSFLHVYHHSTIFLFYWLLLRAGYDGDTYLSIFLNGGIHTIMYTYYFVSMHTRDIWWKKYLTMMQIVQFCCMITQGVCIMFNGDATFPPRVTKIYCGYIFVMLGLFMHFYLQSYTGKSTKTQITGKADNKAHGKLA